MKKKIKSACAKVKSPYNATPLTRQTTQQSEINQSVESSKT
ncbi:hypothetical protein PALB_1380 [Pseudoalteromonas luteoviolacea B = ATCC 29581]|nr:hypothetical protein PALB_1380 [Pseudoalteromonas luteoviolacea B = ATCC 29581]